MAGSLRVGSAVNQEHGDIVTNNDSAYQAAHPATAEQLRRSGNRAGTRQT